MSKPGVKTALLCLLILVTVPLAVSAADFNISSNQTIDVADRTVERGGNTFEITSITQVDPDEQVTVSVDAPDGTDFSMYLYDENQTIVRGYEGTGSKDFDIPVADHGASKAGTYAFIVQSDGVNEAAHPLVVRGYSVSTDTPSSVTAGENISVEGEFTQLRGESFDQIDVVVATTETDKQVVKQAAVDGDTFSASVPTDDLESGSYDVYAVVRGSSTVLGQKEVLGVSSPQLLEIEADDGKEGSSGGSGSGGSSGSGSGGDGGTDTGATEGESSGDIGGNSGAGSGTAPTDDTPETDEQVSLNDGPVTRSVEDADPDQDGINVPVNAGPISRIVFQSAGENAAGEVTVSQSPATTDVFNSQFGASRVKTAVSITVPEALTSTTATVEFHLTKEELNGTAPSELQVVKNTEGGSQVLSSTTNESADGDIVVTARTPGFSDFAIISAPTNTDATTGEKGTTDNDTNGTEASGSTSPDSTNSESTDEQVPGFGITVTLIALLITALVRTRSG
ncbi:PGF-CTERM sorting domain-containing protein [Halorubrum halophilum]|uniref:PGF-CTERM sorting domain-containing protein n=1 Tax=Halorubrum halophilum TaxID=413816 RepID=UPI00186B38D7|nr:PGF-CTERM sorting domain-containing protein [Halorubrum halophilum]